jgi:hypothetical protein
MPLLIKDRVKEFTTTAGTGTVTLTGAAAGFQSFSVIGNGNTTYYAIVGSNEWEVGIGTYTASGTTLSRDTVLESSNGGSKVNFSAGTKEVFVTYPAEKAVYADASDTVNLPSVSVTGGTITGITDLAIADGGTGASTESGARTNLGATTLGSNLFTISNPSAITFPRFNADNTVSSLGASDFRTAIGAGTGNGTVTSVDLSAGTGISVSGGPITGSGSITVTNTAPDQTVTLTGAGATSISGTYPNFTISSTDTDTTYTAGTGLSLVGTTFSNTDRGSSQNIFKNVVVSGQSTIVADGNDDTLNVAAGTGISLTTNASTDTLTITNSAPDQTVVLTAGTGISTSGTYPNFTITNTAPDQVVSLTGSGATTISGTYPNFTISSTDTNTTYTAGNGIALSGTTFSVAAGDGLTQEASGLAVNNTVVRTTGSYADPAWITSINYSKLTGTVPTWNQNTTGNAATATKLATARTISLTGDVTGSTSFDGSGNVSITVAVADDSHNHIISNVDGLQTSLDSKAGIDDVLALSIALG